MNSKTLGFDGKDGLPSAGPSGSGYLPPTLVRQSSVYSLTFDEFQNALGGRGKDFGSMNMDELLKSIWNAEENQTAVASAATTRQGSLTLPESLIQKTVDEVWRDVFRDAGSVQDLSGPTVQPKQRQPTLGEVTLEEFLLKAGVTWEDVTEPRSVITSSNTTTDGNAFYGDASTSDFDGNSGLGLGFPSAANTNSSLAPNQLANSPTVTSLTMNAGGVVPPYSARAPLGNTPELLSWQGLRAGGGIMGTSDSAVNNGLILGMADLGSNEGRTADESSDGLGKGNGNSSSLSPVPSAIDRGLRRKSNGIVEKVVERRQRRMIKNRESAARSRARKQAYTLELEAEIAKLKEQNEELLKKQAEILEMQKSQESKKRCLRRTNTWPRVD
ncbi:unnamed protein product [Spirodela intermedia]|uniref:BZIP domain-containing protein n=1 Tax=Spirodela intermedia TaxID=51605 RepID=A0A7I8J3X9_SPIIN|nr:unnamed protein product [Spirodela intermedia]CAA6664958.1 unnamed protein product [Spirodela intermedia]